MKTPDRRQACSGALEQLNLIDPPPFSPKWPKRSSLPHVALTALLSGKEWTHPDFEEVTGSWRLAEPIRKLRHHFGWPVLTIEIPSPTTDHPDRVIARYALPRWVIDEMTQQVRHG
jgi:hypothetical protein